MLHLGGVDFVEADVVVVETSLPIAVDLVSKFHERAHSFRKVIGFTEVLIVNRIGQPFLLLFTREILESLLILCLGFGCGSGLCLIGPWLHARLVLPPDALLVEVVVIVGGIKRRS